MWRFADSVVLAIIVWNIRKTSKIGHADIIANVIKGLQVRVRWVCFDAFCGLGALLQADLIKNGIELVADVQYNLQVWLETFRM
jgi:hypothetical protein